MNKDKPIADSAAATVKIIKPYTCPKVSCSIKELTKLYKLTLVNKISPYSKSVIIFLL